MERRTVRLLNAAAAAAAAFLVLQLATDALTLRRASPPPPPPEVTRVGDEYVTDYSWRYEGAEHRLVIRTPVSVYDRYRGRVRVPPFDYAEFVVEDEWVRGLASALERMCSGWGYAERVNFLMSFAQGWPYARDVETVGREDYPRYPVETVVDGRGDCEDKAILFASLARSLGIDVCLLLFPKEEHMAAAVAVDRPVGTTYRAGGRLYAYCELTQPGWRVGEKPPLVTSTPWFVFLE